MARPVMDSPFATYFANHTTGLAAAFTVPIRVMAPPSIRCHRALMCAGPAFPDGGRVGFFDAAARFRQDRAAGAPGNVEGVFRSAPG
jgi:hypothetical protein